MSKEDKPRRGGRARGSLFDQAQGITTPPAAAGRNGARPSIFDQAQGTTGTASPPSREKGLFAAAIGDTPKAQPAAPMRKIVRKGKRRPEDEIAPELQEPAIEVEDAAEVKQVPPVQPISVEVQAPDLSGREAPADAVFYGIDETAPPTPSDQKTGPAPVAELPHEDAPEPIAAVEQSAQPARTPKILTADGDDTAIPSAPEAIETTPVDNGSDHVEPESQALLTPEPEQASITPVKGSADPAPFTSAAQNEEPAPAEQPVEMPRFLSRAPDVVEHTPAPADENTDAQHDFDADEEIGPGHPSVEELLARLDEYDARNPRLADAERDGSELPAEDITPEPPDNFSWRPSVPREPELGEPAHEDGRRPIFRPADDGGDSSDIHEPAPTRQPWGRPAEREDNDEPMDSGTGQENKGDQEEPENGAPAQPTRREKLSALVGKTVSLLPIGKDKFKAREFAGNLAKGLWKNKYTILSSAALSFFFGPVAGIALSLGVKTVKSVFEIAREEEKRKWDVLRQKRFYKEFAKNAAFSAAGGFIGFGVREYFDFDIMDMFKHHGAADSVADGLKVEVTPTPGAHPLPDASASPTAPAAPAPDATGAPSTGATPGAAPSPAPTAPGTAAAPATGITSGADVLAPDTTPEAQVSDLLKSVDPSKVDAGSRWAYEGLQNMGTDLPTDLPGKSSMAWKLLEVVHSSTDPAAIAQASDIIEHLGLPDGHPALELAEHNQAYAQAMQGNYKEAAQLWIDTYQPGDTLTAERLEEIARTNLGGMGNAAKAALENN